MGRTEKKYVLYHLHDSLRTVCLGKNSFKGTVSWDELFFLILSYLEYAESIQAYMENTTNLGLFALYKILSKDAESYLNVFGKYAESI